MVVKALSVVAFVVHAHLRSDAVSLQNGRVAVQNTDRKSVVATAKTCTELINEATPLEENLQSEFEPWQGKTFAKLHSCKKRIADNPAKADCFSVSIRRGVAYVVRAYKTPDTESRLEQTLAMIADVAKHNDLPDADFDVDITDGLLEHEHTYGAQPEPIFYVAKRADAPPGTITYPDFTFYDWPESRCPNELPETHPRSWAHLFTALGERGSRMPWSNRISALYFRGNYDVGGRGKKVKFVKDVMKRRKDLRLDLADVRVNRQFKGNRQCTLPSDWCSYKYLLHIPGRTYASSLKYKMLCSSAVVMATSLKDRRPEYSEFWYRVLEDRRNVFFLNADEKTPDVTKLLSNPADVGAQGRNDIQKYLNPQIVQCYWAKLIASMHALTAKSGEPVLGIPLNDYLRKEMWTKDLDFEADHEVQSKL